MAPRKKPRIARPLTGAVGVIGRAPFVMRPPVAAPLRLSMPNGIVTMPGLVLRNRLDADIFEYGPSPFLAPPEGATLIPAGSTTASRQALINAASAGQAFAVEAGQHTANGSNTPKSGQSFTGQYGATIDGGGWSSIDLDDAIFRSVNNGVVDVTIRNLEMKSGPSYGVNSYLTAERWVVDHCDIHHFRSGVSLGKYGAINHSRLRYNVGIPTDPNPAMRGGGYSFNSSIGLRLYHNEICYNGPEQKFGYATLNEPSQDLYIAYNYSHHNISNGVWIDGDGQGSIIEYNRLEDNRQAGITLEIAAGIIARHNTIKRNGEEGILLSATRDCSITVNDLEDNGFGLGLFLDFARLSESYAFWTVDLTGNELTDNVVKLPAGAPSGTASTLSFTSAGDKTPYTSNSKANNFDRNTYRAPNTISNWFFWDAMKSFSQWQALPQDAAGSIEAA